MIEPRNLIELLKFVIETPSEKCTRELLESKFGYEALKYALELNLIESDANVRKKEKLN